MLDRGHTGLVGADVVGVDDGDTVAGAEAELLEKRVRSTPLLIADRAFVAQPRGERPDESCF